MPSLWARLTYPPRTCRTAARCSCRAIPKRRATLRLWRRRSGCSPFRSGFRPLQIPRRFMTTRVLRISVLVRTPRPLIKRNSRFRFHGVFQAVKGRLAGKPAPWAGFSFDRVGFAQTLHCLSGGIPMDDRWMRVRFEAHSFPEGRSRYAYRYALRGAEGSSVVA